MTPHKEEKFPARIVGPVLENIPVVKEAFKKYPNTMSFGILGLAVGLFPTPVFLIPSVIFFTLLGLYHDTQDTNPMRTILKLGLSVIFFIVGGLIILSSFVSSFFIESAKYGGLIGFVWLFAAIWILIKWK